MGYIINHLMSSLTQYAVPNSTDIFTDATMLPSFFDNNLVSPLRIVKVFQNDPQANIRVFYYQYLKLCFEVTDCNYQQYIKKIEQIINNPEFSMVFQEGESQTFNDLQFKQFIMEFFGILGQGEVTIQVALATYPIMDTVFIYFFRSILLLTGYGQSINEYIDKMTLFNFLNQHFEVQMEVHDNSVIRFPQSDIFVYQENPGQVYMAYIQFNQNELIAPSKKAISQEGSEQIIQAPIRIKAPTVHLQPPAPEVKNLISPKPEQHHSRKEGKIEIKESYISDEFLDYTSNSPALHTLINQNKMKQSGSIQQSKYPVKDQATKLGEFKAKEESAKINLPQYVNIKSEYQSENSNNSQFNDKQSSASNNHIINNLIGTKQQFNSWQPPTDSVYGSKVALAYTQNSIYAQSNYASLTTVNNIQNNYPNQSNQSILNGGYTQSTVHNNLNGKNSFSNSNIAIDYGNVQKPGSTFNESKVNSKFEQKKPASYNPPLQQTYEIKQPGFYDPKIIAPAPYIPSYPLVPIGKNPCELNVSQEFTNSFTMKLMKQPHRSNVTGIRQRARNYRNSLKSFLK